MNKNIDLFNRFCGELLSRLYESFPVEKDIILEDFEYLDNEESNSIFFSSINFLKKEGFISYNMAAYRAFTQVGLTAKALTLLDAVPQSIKTKRTRGDELKNIIKEGKSEVIKKIISELIKASMDLIK